MTGNRHTPKTTLTFRRKAAEGTATFGLLLICAALVAPFAGASSPEAVDAFKWVFASGALVYTLARVIPVGAPGDSMRMRRLRRMEFWAGMCFVTASAMWFYHSQHLGPFAGVLAILKDTILFTLAGAAVQIISSWLIASQARKEQDTP